MEVDPEKRNLLLVNKADLMTLEQRKGWADWFEGQGIRFAFYSARLAKEAMETSNEEEEKEDSVEEAEELAEQIDDLSIDATSDISDDSMDEPQISHDPSQSTDVDPRTRILTVHELQSLFLRESPPPKGRSPLILI